MAPVTTAPLLAHAVAGEDVVRALRTDGVHGLTEGEAVARLAIHGPNELPTSGRPSALSVFVAQLKNVLSLILLLAIVLSLALGHGVEAVSIGTIFLFSILLGFVQELRAEKALDALRRMSAPHATVVRDGAARRIPARELVPGDVIRLEAGDLVPADARLLEAVDLQTDEAPLTGESVPVTKQADGVAAPEAGVGDRHGMVHHATAVTYGRARAVVVGTGAGTEVGRIGSLLASVEADKTPLETELDRVGGALGRGAFFVVLLVVGMGLLRGRPVIEMVIFGIALAVAVVPEALPAVVTISLAIGAQRMARRHALVRRLPAVETLGSTTVICTDKTGTLTTGAMAVREVYAGGATFDPGGTGSAAGAGAGRTPPDPRLLAFLRAGAVSTDAELLDPDGDGRRRVRGDPTEGALLLAAAGFGLEKADLEAAAPRSDEIPFSSERKRMTTLHEMASSRVSYSKGALEVVLPDCVRWRTERGDEPLGPRDREAILEAARGMGERAMRVLAVAERCDVTIECAEEGMTFLGIAGMIDPPRAEAKAAVATCHRAGIRPIMITGDHPTTAAAIARELGLGGEGEAVTGVALERMSDDALAEVLPKTSVFARVSPAHKLRIVSALKRRGEVVAMTGDGVNDAPALKRADIGIAMGINGTDVAKEAATMTLTDDDFASIVAAVEEGRAIYDNVKKYLMYLLSSNTGEVLLMAAAMLFGLPLPLSAVQLLYVNLLTDGLPALALAVDPHADDLMTRRPHRPGQSIFSRPVVALMLVGGLWSATVNVALFGWALSSGHTTSEAMTMTFVSLVAIQFFKAYAFRSERRSVFVRPLENRWLNRSVLGELLLLVVLLYVPVFQGPFGVFPLTLVDWVVVAGVALTIVPVLEGVKALERRGVLGATD